MMKWAYRSLSVLFLAVPLLALTTAGPTAGCKGESTGVELYVTACARCHADDLTGGIATGAAKSRDLTQDSWQSTVTDAELRQIIRNGRGEMPAFGSVLSIDKIDSIVKYIRSQKAE
jgi:mono/diheme cytochrome c family protein